MNLTQTNQQIGVLSILNIDKIEEDKEEEEYIITIKETNLPKANLLFKELDERGLDVKIKL